MAIAVGICTMTLSDFKMLMGNTVFTVEYYTYCRILLIIFTVEYCISVITEEYCIG